MTYSDTKEVLKRIKSNYQSFINDDYVLKEWYKELKDYDIEDVMNKLEEHMRSSEFGSNIPKLYFLTKYLKKTEEKGIVEKYFLQCKFCSKFIPEKEFDEHYERCLDVEYITRIRKQYFGQTIDEEKKEIFRNMSKDKFDEKYLTFLNEVYEDVSKEEQERINQIINPPKVKFNLGDYE